MNNKTSWVLELVDYVSGPAKDIVRHVGKISDAFDHAADNSVKFHNTAGALADLKDSFAFADGIADLNTSIGQFTEGSESQVQALTDDVYVLAETYKVQGNEVAKAANAMSKNMGGSFEDNLAIIEQGLKKGANLNGDFLNQLQEYPATVKMTAEEMVATMVHANKQGIWSDKAIDSIKEATLSLLEMDKAQQDALKGIGIKPEDLLPKLNSGNVMEAIRDVSIGLKQTGLTAAQQQKVIADVFKGAGEDAGGVKWVQSLATMETDLDKVVVRETEWQKSQRRTSAMLAEMKLKVFDLTKEYLPLLNAVGTGAMVMANAIPAVGFLGSMLGGTARFAGRLIGVAGRAGIQVAKFGLRALRGGLSVAQFTGKLLYNSAVMGYRFVAALFRASTYTGIYSRATLVAGNVQQWFRTRIIMASLSFNAFAKRVKAFSLKGFITGLWASGKAAVVSGAKWIWAGITGLGSYVGGLVAATAAQWGLNIAMNANPIGLIVLGIVVLGAAIYGLIKYWDTVKEYLLAFGLMAVTYLNPMWWLMKAIEWLFPNTYSAITGFFGDVWDWITEWMQKLWGGIKWLWDKIKVFLGFAGDGVDMDVNMNMGLTENTGDESGKGSIKYYDPKELLKKKEKTNTKPKAERASTTVGGTGRGGNSVTMHLTMNNHFNVNDGADAGKIKKVIINTLVDAARNAGVNIAAG